MTSKATTLKLRIRRLNATIDSNMRSLNRSHSEWLRLIAEPNYPGITPESFAHYQNVTVPARRGR